MEFIASYLSLQRICYKISFVDVNHGIEYGISKYGILNRLFKGIYDMIKKFTL